MIRFPTRFGRQAPKRLEQMVTIGTTVATIAPLAQEAVHALGRAKGLSSGFRQAKERMQQVEESVSSQSSKLGSVVSQLGSGRRSGRSTPKLSHLIEEHADIGMPRSVVYNQWTELELFPSIVKGVAAVDQMEDDRAVWTSKIGPIRREWRARITEQVPDEKIAWCSESGPEHQGVVSFHSLSPDLTRVLVQMHYKPHGPLEVIANELRIQRRRVRRDLRMVKHFIELRGEETGAWRGQIASNRSTRGSSPTRTRKAAAKPTKRASTGRATSRSSNGSARSSNGRTKPRQSRKGATK